MNVNAEFCCVKKQLPYQQRPTLYPLIVGGRVRIVCSALTHACPVLLSRQQMPVPFPVRMLLTSLRSVFARLDTFSSVRNSRPLKIRKNSPSYAIEFKSNRPTLLKEASNLVPLFFATIMVLCESLWAHIGLNDGFCKIPLVLPASLLLTIALGLLGYTLLCHNHGRPAFIGVTEKTHKRINRKNNEKNNGCKR